jgi:drug/metabolite transporter (DMT)-like permease
MTSTRSINSAIGLVVLSTLAFAAMDAGGKHLSGLIAAVVIIWVRFTVQSILMALWILRTRGFGGFRTRHPRLQALRGTLQVTASLTSVIALREMPLAEFTAIIMLAPVLVTVVAGWLLKEPVGIERWGLVLMGFIGTLIVIRPGSDLFGAAALLPLLCMAVISGTFLVSGRLSTLENPFTSQFYTGFVGSMLMLPLLLPQEPAMSAALMQLGYADLALLGAIGVFGTLAHLLLIIAFGLGGTAALMPFTYAQIAFAAIVGWLMFGHIPDSWGWTGMAIIAACGIATAILNARTRRTAGPAVLGAAVD